MRFVVAYSTRISTSVGLTDICDRQIAATDLVLATVLDLDAILEPGYLVDARAVLDRAQELAITAHAKYRVFGHKFDCHRIFSHTEYKN